MLNHSTRAALQALWDREYTELQVIPSTIRPLPSKALLLYDGLINFRELSPVLDIGCGNGRNSIFLALKGCVVEAVDASPAALSLLRQRASEAHVHDVISVKNLLLEGAWPFPTDHFGLTLDSYVFCHILDARPREEFRHELYRVTRPNGMVYTAAFGVDDEYYAELREKSGPIVEDPRNGVVKRLYTEQEFHDFFAERFRVLYQTTFRFQDDVQGKIYRRSILTLMLKK